MGVALAAIRKFIADEDSPTAVEYVLVGMLISVAIVSGASALGQSTKDAILDVANKMANL